MNVLLISRGLPTPQTILGIFEFDQAKALKKCGCDVKVLVLDIRSIRRKRRYGIYKTVEDGIEVIHVSLPLGNININLLAYLAYKGMCVGYRLFLQEWKIDVIHAHFGLVYGKAVSLLSAKIKVPYVITEHDSMINQEKITNKIRRHVTIVYNKAIGVVAVSRALRQKIVLHTSCEPIVIPNIVDVSLFQYAPVAHANFTVVSVGNLIELKRMELLIDVFNHTFKNIVDAQLYIIGDGPKFSVLENRINSLKLSDRVFLLGMQNRETIAELYHKADCFALLSSSETFGVVYIEALAAGLPVLATKCGGPEDFVNNSNGFLVEVDDFVASSNALRDLNINYSKYNRVQISQEVRNYFSPERIGREIVKYYKSVLPDIE